MAKATQIKAHTAGPWTYVHNSWEVSTVYSHDGHGVVAECPIDGGVDELTQDHLEAEKEANARLISVAPDMLAAVIKAEALLTQMLHRDGYQEPGALRALRDAIAKATGAA